MTQSNVSVDLVMDFVCPWCWLGLSQWQAALDKRPKVGVETLIRPYQLDPTVPVEGVDYQTFMQAKFSGDGAERWQHMRAYLDELAPKAGITFRFDEIKIRPNTLRAHRLTRWAAGQGLGFEAAEALFKAYFQDLRDIGDVETLAEIGESIGMDGMVVRDLLASNSDEAAVIEEEFFYRRLGVQGVPAYIFNGQFALSGAESPDVLVQAIDRAAKMPVLAEDE